MFREALERRGERPADAARALKVDDGTMSNWTSGRRKPGRFYAGRICEMYGTPTMAWDEPCRAPDPAPSSPRITDTERQIPAVKATGS